MPLLAIEKLKKELENLPQGEWFTVQWMAWRVGMSIHQLKLLLEELGRAGYCTRPTDFDQQAGTSDFYVRAEISSPFLQYAG